MGDRDDAIAKERAERAGPDASLDTANRRSELLRGLGKFEGEGVAVPDSHMDVVETLWSRLPSESGLVYRVLSDGGGASVLRPQIAKEGRKAPRDGAREMRAIHLVMVGGGEDSTVVNCHLLEGGGTFGSGHPGGGLQFGTRAELISAVAKTIA
jgi:hypothetical protein